MQVEQKQEKFVVYTKWQADSAKARRKLGISADFDGWTGRSRPAGVTLNGVPENARVRDILDCAWAVRQRGNPTLSLHELRKNWFANPSQAVNRSPWGEGSKTICTSSYPYSYEMDRMLVGHDLMKLQGFHTAVAAKRDTIGQNNLQQLAGEAFFIPCVGTILWAWFLNPAAPWWCEGTGNTRLGARAP